MSAQKKGDEDPTYDRQLLLGGAKRNAVLELWEVKRYGIDSYGDADYVSIYGMRPADWYAKGVRLLGRTAVECTRDGLGDAIGKDIAAIAEVDCLAEQPAEQHRQGRNHHDRHQQQPGAPRARVRPAPDPEPEADDREEQRHPEAKRHGCAPTAIPIGVPAAPRCRGGSSGRPHMFRPASAGARRGA